MKKSYITAKSKPLKLGGILHEFVMSPQEITQDINIAKTGFKLHNWDIMQ